MSADPYPVIKYRIYVQRVTSFYTLATMIPSTLFTVLSFTPFFMSFEAGERLGVGVTLVLTIEVSRAALITVLPICGEWLWLEMLFFVNLIFTIASFLESCIVRAPALAHAHTPHAGTRAWLMTPNTRPRLRVHTCHVRRRCSGSPTVRPTS